MRLETLGEFTAWLRSPAENVIVLEYGTPAREASSANRTLSAVFGFYEFHAASGVPVARELVAARAGRGRAAISHFCTGSPRVRVAGSVRLARLSRLPRVADGRAGGRAILGGAAEVADRFLFALLFPRTGMRVGQALGLRH